MGKPCASLDQDPSNRRLPKRLLALNGGGARAVLMVGRLPRIDGILRARAAGRLIKPEHFPAAFDLR